MKYVYILYSSKSDGFYYGSTDDIQQRVNAHNSGLVPSTKPYKPWKIVWYGAFTTSKLASDFEKYLKTGSGKSFAYKRLIQAGVSAKNKQRGLVGT